MTDPIALRSRLVEFRTDVLQRLAEADHLDGGMLSLLANATAALAALDEAEPLDEAVQAERLVVVGCDAAIKVVAYAGSKTAAVVTITPPRAIAIALALLDLAHRRWPS